MTIVGVLCIVFGSGTVIGASIGRMFLYEPPNYDYGWLKQQVWDP